MQTQGLGGPAEAEASAAPGPAEELTLKVDKALLERPGFSIRARLALVFLLFFVLSAGTAIATWVILSRLQTRLQFIEIADQFNNEILQARRFEKNYFLYGTNLEDVLRHTDTADRHLSSSKAEFGSIVGMDSLERLEGHLRLYRELIVQLRSLEGPRPENGAERRAAIEATLRTHGAELVSSALELAQRERNTVRTLLRVSKGVPVALLLGILLLSVYSADFVSRHIIQRLNRLMELTKRIGEGDLSIAPVRKYRDEFTNLVVALNHMTREVEHRHQVMVQSHKLRAVGRLTAGVAHELNNPINNIMLTAAMLQEDYRTLSDEDRLDMITDLEEQAERSRKIVRNLLDFAREGEMEMGRLDVRDIVRESLALVANQLKLSRVKATLDLADNLPPVNGDRQYLSQIFVNLVLNAVDAMPEGGSLHIASDAELEGGFLALHVTDSGHGIPEHILQSIFDPFFTTKSTGKGTGLGLSVSLGIARSHGGDIRVASRRGEGTTFTVLLPILNVPAALAEGSAARAATARGAAAGRGILRAVLLGGVLLATSSCQGDSPTRSDPPGEGQWEWTLIWRDEFDSGSTPTAPQPRYWGYEIGYVRNREWQYYTDDIQNAYCQDGLLHIEARQHPPGTYPMGPDRGQDGSISSASLISRDRVHFLYGRLEMRGRIDTQWGSWPAFWSLGAGGEWPDNGECDIMEYYQGRLLFNVAWWRAGDPRWTPRWDSETVSLATLPAGWADQFHVWAMEWDAKGVRLFMDDLLYNEWDSSQDAGDTSIEGFQQDHFFILNQAIGGTAGGDASHVLYPTRYEVDYVRLYEKVQRP